MIRKLLATSIIALSVSATASAAEWVHVADVDASTILLDHSSIAAAGKFQSVQVLRNYDRLINLGSDPDTKELWYPHRSVQLSYLADCGAKKVALDAWQMHSGNFGNGDVVWADRFAGAPAFVVPSSSEESAALDNACAKTAALSLVSFAN